MTRSFAQRIDHTLAIAEATPQEWDHIPLDLLRRLAIKIDTCSRESGFRCGLAACPRCAAWRARRRKRDLGDRLSALPPKTPLAFMTMTLASDDLKDGLKMLKVIVQKLRRTVAWKGAVKGGHLHFEATRSMGEVRRWNVHVHLMLEVSGASSFATLHMVREDWPHRVQKEAPGHTGTGDLEEIRDLGSHGHEHPTIAFYVTKRPSKWALALSPHDFAEVLLANRGTHLTCRFGTWRKVISATHGAVRGRTPRP